MPSKWHWFWRWLCLLVTFFLVSYAAIISPNNSYWISLVEFTTRDLLIRNNVETNHHSQIVIVDINDDSIKKMGPWPWSRKQLSQLIEKIIIEGQAQQVILDIVLPEAKDLSGDKRILSLAKTNRLVLAQTFDYVQRNQSIQIGEPAGAIFTPSESTQATGYIANHAGLLSAPCVGNIGYIPDLDGQVRRLPLWTNWNNNYYPSLAMAAMVCNNPSIASQFQVNAASWVIPYRYEFASFDIIPAQEIYNKNNNFALLRNKIVFIGSSALGLTDQVATPLDNHTSGVMVHASALASLKEMSMNTSISAHASWILIIFLVFSMWGLLIGAFNQWGRWRWMILLPGFILWYFWALQLINSAHPFTISAPLIGLVFLLSVLFPIEWWFTRQFFQRSMQLLSQYVGPTILEALSKNDYAQVLQPQLKEVTVLVLDLEGYTNLINNCNLTEAAQLTKDFLSLMTDVILHHQGTLDKYTGDGLIAFWGAPKAQEHDAYQAVCAAQSLLFTLKKYNQEREEKKLTPLSIRIGIATGFALVGDLGTSFRSTYTAVGGCINLASRLQSEARHHNVKILVDNHTKQKIQNLNFQDIGLINIRGKDLPEHVFSPI